ncbi:MAG: nucleotidyltransferase family protein [Candidatus Omnitrophica bacterium]|nr:nucleotidyltransferase family protein [Candidatus Omnitrophota bacterium]
MNVVILAAGYGTRLYPLTKNTAKPLLLVNGKPIINFILDKVYGLSKDYKISRIKVVSNNKFYNDFKKWNEKYKVNAEIINDGTNCPQERKGAILAIKYAIGKSKEDFLVLGGDNLFEDDLKEFMALTRQRKKMPCVGLFDVKTKKNAVRFGIVETNRQMRLISLDEKPKKPKSTLAATCIYFFPKETAGLLDVFLREHQGTDASGKYIEWLIKQTKVYGTVFKGKWLDIGHNDALKEAAVIFKS